MPDSLESVAAQVRVCARCRLAESRTHAVPGQGDTSAKLMLVGEAPGAREDQTGLPFQGLSGRFLDRCLAEMGLERNRVFISSVNKCRPPGNRVPRRDEMAACAGYLERQLTLVQPAVVLAMGGTAAGRLHPEATGRPLNVTQLRGLPIPLGPDRALVVTYHPAAGDALPRPAPAVPRRPGTGRPAGRPDPGRPAVGIPWWEVTTWPPRRSRDGRPSPPRRGGRPSCAASAARASDWAARSGSRKGSASRRAQVENPHAARGRCDQSRLGVPSAGHVARRVL